METKFRIVETEDYILAVSDEERGVEEYNYNFGLSKINKLTKTYPAHSTEWNFCKKIIAYQSKNNAPELDLPLLPEMAVEDEVERLAEKLFPMNMVGGGISKSDRQLQQNAFKKGYKAATKVYSEEDVYDILDLGANNKGLRKGEILDLFNKSKQSKTPKWFVAEIEDVFSENNESFIHSSGAKGNYSTHNKKLKTTTINGKTYLVGKYLNE
jgi:hypothetical protein